MTKKTEKNLIVGLDIGTSKVVAIVGEITADGNIEIIGLGSHPSRGLKKAWWLILNLQCSRFSVRLKRPN